MDELIRFCTDHQNTALALAVGIYVLIGGTVALYLWERSDDKVIAVFGWPLVLVFWPSVVLKWLLDHYRT